MTRHVWAILRVSWWGICPVFAVLVVGFVRDRACFDRFHLLPGVETQTPLAWILAAAYVLGHCWLAAAYACAAVASDSPIPAPRELVAALSHAPMHVVAMVILIVLEYSPAGVWAHLARLAGACPG